MQSPRSWSLAAAGSGPSRSRHGVNDAEQALVGPWGCGEDREDLVEARQGRGVAHLVAVDVREDTAGLLDEEVGRDAVPDPARPHHPAAVAALDQHGRVIDAVGDAQPPD